jgi:hypothetical protein
MHTATISTKKLERLQQKQTKHQKHALHKDQHFYPRIKNLTNIRLNEEETQMLKYGLNCSIERPYIHTFGTTWR